MSTAEQQMNDLETEIATKQEQAMAAYDDSPVANVFAVLGNRSMKSAHNFTGGPVEVWKQTQLCSGDGIKKGDAVVNNPLLITGFYIHEVDVHDKNTRQMVRQLRTVLITKEGDRIAFVSGGIALDLAAMIQTLPQDMWKEGIPCKVVSIPTAPPKRVFRIMPL